MEDSHERTRFPRSAGEYESSEISIRRYQSPSPFVGEYLYNFEGMSPTDLKTFKRITGLCRSSEMDLYWAVRLNNVALVEKLFTQNHSPNTIFRWKFEFEGGSREFFQFPLHRAAQTGNPELVELLLQHGSDPNSIDSVGRTPLQLLFQCNVDLTSDRTADRSSTDPVVAGILLEGGTKIDEEMWCSLFALANRSVPARWSFLELLLSEENCGRNRLLDDCRDCDNDDQTFFRIVTECGEGDINGMYGYRVLEYCLKAGMEQHVLQHSLQLAIKQEAIFPAAILLLIKAGVDVNAEIVDKGKTATPLYFLFSKITKLIGKYLERDFIDEFHSGELDSEFSIVWLLIKAGNVSHISSSSFDIYSHLGQNETSIRLLYDKTLHYSEKKNWSCRRRVAVLGHLQRCLNIIREIQPHNSLMELSRIVVRKALGPWSDDKMDQLQLPARIKECIKYHDCQAIVDGVAKYDWTWHDLEQGRISPVSTSDDSDESSDEDWRASSDEEQSDVWTNTRRGLNKIVAIRQTVFSNIFSRSFLK